MILFRGFNYPKERFIFFDHAEIGARTLFDGVKTALQIHNLGLHCPVSFAQPFIFRALDADFSV